MTNKNAPHGLKPLRYKSGATYNGAVNAYFLPSSYNQDVFLGDAVVRVAGSNTSSFKDGNSEYAPGTLPLLNRATVGATNTITGVAIGFGADPTNLEETFRNGTDERVVWVADDPNLLFSIQDDGLNALSAATVGLNANLTDVVAGSTFNGLSGTQLDSSAPAVDATFQLDIVRVSPEVNNEIALNAEWEVGIQLHTEK